MGQKVNPHGLRVGIIKDWDSKWYAEGDFADCLVEDYKIREFLKDRLYNAGISKIEIERASEKVKIIIYSAKPGVVIGKGGAEIEKLKKDIEECTTVANDIEKISSAEELNKYLLEYYKKTGIDLPWGNVDFEDYWASDNRQLVFN